MVWQLGGQEGLGWASPAAACHPLVEGSRHDLLFRFGSGVGVAHLLGRHEAGRGHVGGKIRLGGPEGPSGKLGCATCFLHSSRQIT